MGKLAARHFWSDRGGLLLWCLLYLIGTSSYGLIGVYGARGFSLGLVISGWSCFALGCVSAIGIFRRERWGLQLAIALCVMHLGFDFMTSTWQLYAGERLPLPTFRMFGPALALWCFVNAYRESYPSARPRNRKVRSV